MFTYLLALFGTLPLVHAFSDQGYCALLLAMTSQRCSLNTVAMEGGFAVFHAFHIVALLFALLRRHRAERFARTMFSHRHFATLEAIRAAHLRANDPVGAVLRVAAFRHTLPNARTLADSLVGNAP